MSVAASRPDSLSKGGAVPKKKIEVSMRILGDESRSGSEDDLLASVEGQKTPEDLNTPDITLGELEWESEWGTCQFSVFMVPICIHKHLILILEYR